MGSTKRRLLGFLIILLVGICLGFSADGQPLPSFCISPKNVRLSNFVVELEWSYRDREVKQYHLQVVPANNDGPGIDIIRSTEQGWAQYGYFAVPPPPQWYGLLPDIRYQWRTRSSYANNSITPDDPSWGPWAWDIGCSFITPLASSSTISLMGPAQDSVVTTLTPTLQWGNSQPEVFYYEVQLSKDLKFETTPNLATASVYWNLVHGGVTSPMNSYTVPPSSALDTDTQYHWRVRPRIQGSGTPVAWSTTWSFRTPKQ
ncbi:MAG: hypothetical protein HW403_905 [Dehalococcoidia bacterium]|nr:hypothetical protein [Dehalococcoidia bacterium]